MIPAIVVPILNRYDLLERLLVSIDYPVGYFLLIDNNPKSDFVLMTNEHVKEQYHLRMPSNLGVPTSWNLGIKSLPYCDYWLIVNNDAYFPKGSLQMFAENSSSGRLLLSGGQPPWCAFSIGADIVKIVGLFDEGIYPAYYEDNDYMRRMNFHNFPIHQSNIPVNHDNSSTISSGYSEQNSRTFSNNMLYYDNKIKSNDYTQGQWSLETRLKNRWD